MRILHATYIVPLHGPLLENAYLYIEDDGTIIHYTDVAPITDQFEVERYEGLLCPGFVNTHCHIELSHMKNLVGEGTGLPAFVAQIPKKRSQATEHLDAALKAADQHMRDTGTVAVGDISNADHSIAVKRESSILYHSFVELYGLDASKAPQIVRKGLALLEDFRSNNLLASLVPHSPYTLSSELLEAIYRYSDKELISIHHQETPSEMELFQKGQGELMESFESRGLDMSQQKSFQGSSSDYSLLSYLSPDQRLLLVHNTCSEDDDIHKVERYFNQVYWCTCPKSNWYIERRLPNYDLWRQHQLKITVGTDSLASNKSLNMLEELQFIQSKFPHIPTEELLLWACKNGAEALGFKDLGAFVAGNRPGVLLIQGLEGTVLTKASKVKVLA